MWYEKLIEAFISKINVDDQENAKKFLDFLFAQLKEIVFESNADTHFQIEMMLGVISNLFLKLNNAPEGTITLNYFAKFIIGLVVIYAKHGNENADFWSVHFIPFLIKSKKLGLTELSELITSYEQALVAGKRVFVFAKNSKRLPFRAQAQTLTINAVEKWVLSELKYEISINIPREMISAFKTMHSGLLSDFLGESSFLLGRSVEFDAFIDSLYKEIYEPFGGLAQLSEAEQQFFSNLQALINLVHEFEPTNEKIQHLIFRLQIASYAYMLHRDSSSYSRFANSCLNEIRKMTVACGENYPNLKLTLERLYYFLKAVGLLYIQFETDDALFVEEIAVVVQLEGLKKDLTFIGEMSYKTAERVLLAIVDAAAGYMQNRNTANLKLLRKSCAEIIEQGRSVLEKEPQGKLFLARVEFVLLSLELINQLSNKKQEASDSNNRSQTYGEREYKFHSRFETFSNLVKQFFDKASIDDRFTLYARIAEIIESVISTATLVYFQNRTDDNYQVLKWLSANLESDYGLMLFKLAPKLSALDSSLPYEELHKSLIKLNLALVKLEESRMDYYRKGGKHTSFPFVQIPEQESTSRDRSFSF
ncbi:hypothetical protein [Legionella micdadei]|uniref:hypothetical protein n=1 Tax=Legionella micdadei TaxID=451 RepID=UPI0009EF7F38|nr:hypothetical protein [Legionella micdadei]ARH00245.1 hypothetical protein B6V88_07335 [Legionella micdadei]